MGQGLPRPGPDDRRRPRARVRASRRRPSNVERAIEAERDRVPGRAGQRDRDLERLGQPVLAREVPDRRARATSATRTSARATTTRPRPRSARCWPSRARRPGATVEGRSRVRPERRGDAGDLPRRRARRALPARPPQLGTATYTPYDGDLPESHFTLGGRWTVDDESATAGPGATLRANVTGKDVYLVLSGPGTVEVRSTASPSRPSRSPRSSSTTCSRARRPARTTCSCASRPASPATRSRSAEWRRRP